jgi:protein subunit release factor B
MTGPDKSKLDALEKKMNQLGISRNDIEEKFIKASGKGGQKVNKSVSGVFLKHIPTGLLVKCAKSRSQHLNRFLAMRSLVEKLESLAGGGPDRAREQISKIKKQKARRRRKTRKKLTDE